MLIRNIEELSDEVIRENPASRGTEASAEGLVGPPWRMESTESRTPVHSSGTRLTLALTYFTFTYKNQVSKGAFPISLRKVKGLYK